MSAAVAQRGAAAVEALTHVGRELRCARGVQAVVGRLDLEHSAQRVAKVLAEERVARLALEGARVLPYAAQQARQASCVGHGGWWRAADTLT